jgi:hypothetical protein
MTGQARLFDPATSYQAARVIGEGVEHAVYRAHCANDGMTDDELVKGCPGFYGPTLKSARSRLAKRGLLADSGQRRKSDRGCDSIVWVLAS